MQLDEMQGSREILDHIQKRMMEVQAKPITNVDAAELAIDMLATDIETIAAILEEVLEHLSAKVPQDAACN